MRVSGAVEFEEERKPLLLVARLRRIVADRYGDGVVLQGAVAEVAFRPGRVAAAEGVAPGAYTAKIFDQTGGQGCALAEFYDRTASGASNPYNRLVNISTRGRVGVGDNVLIAGFVIAGDAPKQVLVRGIGPGLAQYGVNDYLRDPFIRIVRDGVVRAQNDDWALSNQGGLVEAASIPVGAFTLDPDSRDSALVVTLDPGAYTVLLFGADGGDGVAPVEVYDLE